MKKEKISFIVMILWSLSWLVLGTTVPVMNSVSSSNQADTTPQLEFLSFFGGTGIERPVEVMYYCSEKWAKLNFKVIQSLIIKKIENFS